MRAPAVTDGFMLYVENDPNTGIDDQWIPLVVTAIDAGLCGWPRLRVYPHHRHTHNRLRRLTSP